MGKEIEDELTSDSSSSDEETAAADLTVKEAGLLESSDDSLTGEMPKGQKRKKPPRKNDEDSDEDGPVERFRRGENVPSDYEIASQSDDDDDVRMKNQEVAAADYDDDTRDIDEDGDEEDDELGAQLEREFLKDCNSS